MEGGVLPFFAPVPAMMGVSGHQGIGMFQQITTKQV